ncbi:MAG: hypothetical protein KGY38_01925 [Desulfobacterales bacterium]|nr:hypothetical protein [Desulfobacterales bacterium]
MELMTGLTVLVFVGVAALGHTLTTLVTAKQDDPDPPATVSRPQQPDYECKSPS